MLKVFLFNFLLIETRFVS